MDQYLSLTLYIAALVLFQTDTAPPAGFDWLGKVVAPSLAAFATIYTVWSQVRSARAKQQDEKERERLQAEIKQAQTKQEASERVMSAWETLTARQELEMVDIRKRLRLQERHTQICERGQMKLVAQLLKAGVEVDLDAILSDLTAAEMAIHDTNYPPSPKE